MGIFIKRRFGLSCFLFVMGALLGFFGGEELRRPALLLIAVFASVIAAISAVRRKKQYIIAFLLPMLFGMIGMLYFLNYSNHLSADFEKYADLENSSQIEAVVISRSYLSNYLSIYDLDAESINGEEIDFKIRLEADFSLEIPVGSRISLNAYLGDFDSGGSFDEKQYFNSKGFIFLALATDSDVRILEEDVKSFKLIFSAMNKRFSGYFEDVLEPTAAGLVDAVFLGNRNGLEDTVKRDFTRTGTVHLLALSGLHLSLISAMAEFILKALKLRKSVRYACLPILVLFYAALTGFSLSVMRSAIMLIFMYASYFIRAKKDPLTSLLFAAMFILIIMPSSIRDIGFWMSVCATFGILMILPLETLVRFKLRKTFKGIFGKLFRYIISCLLISFSAILMTLPFSCFCFGSLSIVGPFATLVLSPLVSVILFISPLMLILSPLGIFDGIGAFILNRVSAAAVKIVSELSELEHIYISLEYSFVKYIVISFFVLLGIMLIFELKHKIIIPIFVLCFVVMFSVLEYRAINGDEYLTEYSIDKQCEYISISHKGQNILVDISDGTKGRLYDAVTASIELGYKELDTLVLTHLHSRHINSVSSAASKAKLRTMIIPLPENDSENSVLEGLKEEGERLGIKLMYYEKGAKIPIVEDCILSVDREYISRSTHPIVRLEIRGEIDLAYFGSSFNETDLEYTSARNIIFGTHGPICKKEFIVESSDEEGLIILADEEIYGFARLNADNSEIILSPCRVRLK